MFHKGLPYHCNVSNHAPYILFISQLLATGTAMSAGDKPVSNDPHARE